MRLKTSARPRDNQRTLVYSWEEEIGTYRLPPEWKTIEEVCQWAQPIWLAERARYGQARKVCPDIVSSSWGQKRALAHASHKISLPLWARQRPMVLHELAHLLTPKDEAHGPRFVAVLIGLLCRHAGYRADELMALADAMGVKYHARSIGALPARTLSERLEALLPISDMDAAIELDVTWRQVRGAALRLLASKRARWLRGKLVWLDSSKLGAC